MRSVLMRIWYVQPWNLQCSAGLHWPCCFNLGGSSVMDSQSISSSVQLVNDSLLLLLKQTLEIWGYGTFSWGTADCPAAPHPTTLLFLQCCCHTHSRQGLCWRWSRRSMEHVHGGNHHKELLSLCSHVIDMNVKYAFFFFFTVSSA